MYQWSIELEGIFVLPLAPLWVLHSYLLKEATIDPLYLWVIIAPIKVEEKAITYDDPIVPTAYVEKPHFPIRIKDHARASTIVNKSNIRTHKPSK